MVTHPTIMPFFGLVLSQDQNPYNIKIFKVCYISNQPPKMPNFWTCIVVRPKTKKYYYYLDYIYGSLAY